MDNCNSYNHKNLSSVLSLKTELLRKKNDILKLKNSRSTCKDYDSKISELKYKSCSSDKNAKADKSVTDSAVPHIDDLNVLAESKKILHMKAQVYDHMAALDMDTDHDTETNTLIAFERKSSRNIHHKDMYCSDTDIECLNDSIEYIDEFGRTRKCSLEELKRNQKQDCSSALKTNQSLLPTISNVHSSCKQFDPIDSDKEKEQEKRLGWEQKTVENSHKEQLHYQDVFFDEARQHGVSYYGFSTNDTERLRQQKELQSIRQKTLEEQTYRSQQRTQRESIKSMRVLAAKNRKRARLGIPPLPMEQLELKEQNIIEKNETNEEKPEAISYLDPDIERKRYNRPWNKDKIESDWFVKSERLPMSQQQWNEHKRKERIKEFAPPQAHSAPNNKNIASANSIYSADYMPIATIEAKLYQLRSSN